MRGRGTMGENGEYTVVSDNIVSFFLDSWVFVNSCCYILNVYY